VDYFQISVKTDDHLDNFLAKIYDEISSNNSGKNLLPIYQVDKCISKSFSIEICKRSFSLILVGETAPMKTNIMTRYTVI